MAYATSAEFLGRVDATVLEQLVAPDSGAPDETRITTALEDASAELDGYLPRISESRRPGTALLRLHAIKIALYLLTMHRPVADFDSIRKAYEDTIAFYTGLIADPDPAPIGGTSDAPYPVFDDDSLKGLV